MKNKAILSLMILFFMSGFIPLSAQGLIFQKDIVVEKGEVEDNVISFGGEILIKGRVTETAIAFGGKIIIEGEVDGTVVGFGADIILESTARVSEDIVVIGGLLKKEYGSTIGGDTVQFGFETPEDVRKFLGEGLGGVLGMRLIPFLLVLKLISTLIWFLLAILMAAIVPRQIAYASSQIRTAFWPVFGVGLLSIIVYTALCIFAGLLSLILIGIPILIALVILGIIIKIFGRVTVFCFFGESLGRAFGSKNPSTIGSVILGFILVSFIGFIPIFGTLFYLVLSFLGWGSVIRTKFGTRSSPVQVTPST
ncbi:MAG: hypothetical protein JXB23_16585 [Candidatus Aminicenantes bacterium]|nr:hypothetical protein [Candidatus Aminicenantes bacterium]